MTELIVATSFLAVMAMLMKIGVDIVNDMTKQRAYVEIQREAQVTLYDVIRSARNADEIFRADPDKLQLTVFNRKKFTEYNDRDLYHVDKGTQTYEFVSELSGDSYLLCTTEFPEGTTLKKHLVNKLLLPTTTDYIFKGFPEDLTAPYRYEYVHVALRLSDKILKGSTRTYEGESLKRSQTVMVE